MDFDSSSSLALLPIICAAALNFILWLVVIYFGEGGKGVIGDIRTAIGKALPLPMAGTIWIVALTLSSQKLVEINGWDSVIAMQVGDDSLGLKSLIGMKRTALIILMITWFVSRAIQAFSVVLNDWHNQQEGVSLDTTAIQALASISVVLVWVVGIVVMLQTLGMNMRRSHHCWRNWWCCIRICIQRCHSKFLWRAALFCSTDLS